MKNRMVKIALPILILLVGILAVQATGLFEQPQTDNHQFSQQVNLAMRQAADRLLDLAGDSTRTIPPVEEILPGEFVLRLENNFNYDSLPTYLEEAIQQFDIQEPYFVTVNDCLQNLLMLGYSNETLEEGQTPCGGREQKAGCYNLSIVFPGLKPEEGSAHWVWLGLATLLLTGIAAGYFLKGLKKKDIPVAAPPSPVSSNIVGMQIGNTRFDAANLLVQIEGNRQQLTFREAKLLQFFAERPNQVLERDAILAAVWEDEGVIVGRSLDVFVSRLRKILQKDPSLKIVNIHGVGYRLEVEGV